MIRAFLTDILRGTNTTDRASIKEAGRLRDTMEGSEKFRKHLPCYMCYDEFVIRVFCGLKKIHPELVLSSPSSFAEAVYQWAKRENSLFLESFVKNADNYPIKRCIAYFREIVEAPEKEEEEIVSE